MPVTRPRRRATVACTACRQSKIQCALVDGEPPCSRCRRLALDCTVDRQFRRVHKTTQVEELQDQLNELRQHLSASGPSPGSRGDPNPVEEETSGRSAAPQLTANGNAAGAARLPGTVQTSSSTFSRTQMRDVILSADRITELFQIFFDDYHHFLPFLDEKTSPESYYLSSPLLYWSIIAVASRQYRRESSLLHRLGPILSEAVWSIFGTCPMTVPNIQTLLLLSTWPLPNIHLWNDSSLVMCNTALTCALHLGLHRPGREEEYTRDTVVMGNQGSREGLTARTEKLRERNRTWCACIAVAQSLSIDFGYSNLLNPFALSLEPTVYDSIPSELRDNVVVQKCAHEAFQLMARHQLQAQDLAASSAMFDGMREADSLFSNLEHELDSCLSFMNRLRLQSSRLSLQTLAFINDSTHPQRKAWVLKTHHTACQVINLVLADPMSHSLLPHAPLMTFRILWNAAAVIFRVVHSTYRADIDISHSHVTFTAAAFALRQLSVPHEQKDIATRASDLLTFLWRCAQADQTLTLKPPELCVKSRMTSSLTFDTLMMARSFAARESGTWLAYRQSHAPELVTDGEHPDKANDGWEVEVNAPEHDVAAVQFDGLLQDNIFASVPFAEVDQALPPAWYLSPDLSWTANFGYQ
ncbi:hypothetical protein ABEF93_007783 [Exophiala dermatitidis]